MPDPSGLPVDPMALEGMLLEARRRLAMARLSGSGLSAGNHAAAAQRDPEGLDGADGRGGSRASDADGQIVVTAALGRIARVELDPRVLRLDPGELAGRLEKLLDEALSDLRAAMPAGDARPAVDLRAVARELDQVRSDASRQMREISGGIADAVAQFRRGAEVSGYVVVPDLDGLLVDLAGVLAPIASAQEDAQEQVDGDDAPAGIQGTGESADGLVRVTADPGPHVASLRIEARAIRAGSHDLADRVTTAVNAALDDLAARQPRRAADLTAVDRTELTKRLQEIQDRGADQLRALGSALSALMSSMRPADRGQAER
jgi:DNA-binding protein YbaB